MNLYSLFLLLRCGLFYSHPLHGYGRYISETLH
ncbi:Uncharacterised protein [Vibrio cholerae]|nr:Uncharacterised protein [Vibrio cholerae]